MVTSCCSSTSEVKEYRAPTDESVRLLNEMQEKALGNIVATAVISNKLDGMSLVVKRNDIYQEAYFWFKLNGEYFDHTIRISDVWTQEKLLEQLIKTMAEVITEKLIMFARRDNPANLDIKEYNVTIDS